MNPVQLSEAKITPPTLPKDHLSRNHLVKKMDKALCDRHLCIQAPSGYGKTTLMVELLNTQDINAVWFSISSSENDLIPFLSYLAFALNSGGVELKLTMEILTAERLQNLDQIKEQFLVDLENSSKKNTIVLDDFHLITDKEVIDFVWKMIERCVENTRILIGSRTRLPAKGDWKNIPILAIIEPNELRFSPQEYLEFKEKLIHSSVYIEQEYQEGWIAGINISLKRPEALQYQSTVELIKNTAANFVNPEFVYFLASLNLFNAELCNAILGDDKIIDELSRSIIILVQIDDKAQHFRLHHFCQEIIEENTPKDLLPALKILQKKTAKFYLDIGSYALAYETAKKFDLEDLTYQSFQFYRLACFNNSDLYALQALFSSIQNTDLLSKEEHQINLAWLDVLRGDTFSMIKRISPLNVKNVPQFLVGEYWALKAYTSYSFNRHQDALDESKYVETKKIKNRFAEGYMHIFKIGGLQALKRSDEAYAHGISTLAVTNISTIKSHVLLGLSYISRLEAKQQKQFDYSRALLALSKEKENVEGIVNAYSFIGEYHFNRAEYKSAEKVLKRGLEFKQNAIGVIGMSFSTLYARVLFAIGKKSQAFAFLNEEIEQYIIYGNGFLVPYLEALRAEFSFLSNDKNEAQIWAQAIDVAPSTTISEAYSTILGKLRIMLANPLTFPDKLLGDLKVSLSNANNKRYLAESKLIECCLHLSLGNYEASHVAIADVLKMLPLLQFKSLYETYILYSPDLAELINDHTSNLESLSLSKKVKITNRENQIIDLYTLRLTDQEMANQLGISLSTLKRHNVNIFNKLQVSSKRQVLVVFDKK
jgi:ATP/maltotriose-dependent transcriptional regulator MalT